MKKFEKIELSKNLVEAAKEITRYDAEIAIDTNKYSAWLLAVAVAGFSGSIFSRKTIGIYSWADDIVLMLLLLLSEFILFISILLGAVVWSDINNYNEAIKKRMTYLLAQGIHMQNNPDIIEDEDIIENRYFDKFKEGEYFYSKEKERYVGRSTFVVVKYYIRYSRHFKLQLFFLLVGYLVIIIASLPKAVIQFIIN